METYVINIKFTRKRYLALMQILYSYGYVWKGPDHSTTFMMNHSFMKNKNLQIYVDPENGIGWNCDSETLKYFLNEGSKLIEMEKICEDNLMRI